MQHRWDEETVRQIYDSVLVNSVIEFRTALSMMKSTDSASASGYVREIERGLRVMEAELQRRGLRIEEQDDGSPVVHRDSAT